MTTEVKIHITEDDLSESIKAKIKQLRKQGINVEIIWPKNYDPDEYNKLPYITPAPIYPQQQDPSWPNQTPSAPNTTPYDPWYPWRSPDIYCTATCTLN